MRINHTWLPVALGLALFGAREARGIDYWDAGIFNDNSASNTHNEMTHDVEQQHDLQAIGGVPDQDWSFVTNAPYASYEVIVDQPSADLQVPQLTRVADDGTTVLQVSEAENIGATVGFNRALRWENAAGTFSLNFLRILADPAGCGNACGPDAQYRVRLFETTIAVPRFNNFGGQVTVLIVQNPTAWTRDIAGTVYFWSPTGTLLGSQTFSLPTRAALVLNTNTVAGVSGQRGTITIAHDGGLGNLAVKSVALEPATGFSFDSPGSYKPR